MPSKAETWLHKKSTNYTPSGLVEVAIKLDELEQNNWRKDLEKTGMIFAYNDDAIEDTVLFICNCSIKDVFWVWSASFQQQFFSQVAGLSCCAERKV